MFYLGKKRNNYLFRKNINNYLAEPPEMPPLSNAIHWKFIRDGQKIDIMLRQNNIKKYLLLVYYNHQATSIQWN